MNPSDPPVTGPKNEPMQPVAWTRVYRNENGTANRILCTTMGAATDLENEGHQGHAMEVLKAKAIDFARQIDELRCLLVESAPKDARRGKA